MCYLSLSIPDLIVCRGLISECVHHAAWSFPHIIGPFINYLNMFILGMVKEGIWQSEQELDDSNGGP
jgi:hypothetical protein